MQNGGDSIHNLPTCTDYLQVNEGKVVVYDHELRRNLHLSTADLRFADFIVKNVADEHDDVFLDQTGKAEEKLLIQSH